jgi:uncharacterized protein with ATP-grasp and redox domains
MKTTLDCLPCFLKQALQTARLVTEDRSLQRKILDQVAQLLPQLDFSLSPPENSVLMYDLIAELSGRSDPFSAIKKSSNVLAKSLEPQIIKEINESKDPLYTAFLYSVAGNIIDYGANHDFDVAGVLKRCRNQHFTLNSYNQFTEEIREASTLLYLGDNSGEIVFDTLVIKQLQQQFPHIKIVFAVRQRPILNDALPEDARFCGLPDLCTVIDNGTGCPGTPLKHCSEEFKTFYNNADMIISKGQGNFETLSEQKGLYFLLICKCPVITEHLHTLSHATVEIGDLIFFKP